MKDNFCNFLQTSSLLDQKNICTELKSLYLSDWILLFQNSYNKVAIEIRLVQFWSVIMNKQKFQQAH